MTSRTMARTKRYPRRQGRSMRTRQRQRSTDPPTHAAADRILAVCRPTAAVIADTNVPRRSCPGERRRGPHPHAGRRITGYYLDRGVNARIRRLTHGAPTGRRESAQEQSGPPRLAESTALCRSLSPGCEYTLVPLTRHVLGGALALGKLFDLQIASDIRPLSSDEQALGLLESVTATPHGSVSPRVSPAGASA